MAAARFGTLARQFSTSAARTQLVKAPIQVFGLEGRYAHALYSAASKEKKLDVVEKELQGFQATLTKDVKLAEFIADPTIKRLEKKNAMQQLMEKQKASPLTTNLFTAMAENGRISKVNSIISAFGKIMSAHRGEVVCTVTTAKPLEAANQKEVEAALKGFLKQGETLQLVLEVDPTIIGGMIVNIGDDKFVDMSTESKIKTYTNLIKQAV